MKTMVSSGADGRAGGPAAGVGEAWRDVPPGTARRRERAGLRGEGGSVRPGGEVGSREGRAGPLMPWGESCGLGRGREGSVCVKAVGSTLQNIYKRSGWTEGLLPFFFPICILLF